MPVKWCPYDGNLLHHVGTRVARRISMLDAVLLGLGLAFFALSVGYAYACDRL